MKLSAYPKHSTNKAAQSLGALPDNLAASGASLQEQTSQEETARKAPLFPPPVEPLPVGIALFRVMRAVMFEETPQPELDALPLAQLRLLWTVFFATDATMKDCSERLGVSQSTVTQLADRLVKRGLVERLDDPADRRIVRLSVSRNGQEILMQAKAREHQTLQAVWEALTLDEQADVMRGLEILGRTTEDFRTAQGRALPPLSDYQRLPQHPKQPNTASSGQPVVDLMARRVRGKK